MTLDYFKAKKGYEIDGVWYPKVTTICGIIAKPGLERWLANQNGFAAMQVKRKKITDWGRLVHDTIEKILRGETPKINPAIRPSIEAFLNWLNEHKVKVFDIEKRVFSKKHLYAGTLDVLGEIDGNFGILDLKTSKEIWDEYFIQTAAYVQAHNEQASKKAKTHWILRIDQYQECNLCGARKRIKGGEIEVKRGKRYCKHKWAPLKGVFELKEVDSHRVFIDAFLNAKKLWEFSNRDFLSKITNYPSRLI